MFFSISALSAHGLGLSWHAVGTWDAHGEGMNKWMNEWVRMPGGLCEHRRVVEADPGADEAE